MRQERVLALLVTSLTMLGGCAKIGEIYRGENGYRRVHPVAVGSVGTDQPDLARLLDPLYLGEKRV